ncbi:MAG: type II toxin-antitoxin system Phd/YefM family antitoxin [Alphaproteobacteria bacterium]|nr:type II toxin-antitoxin system Phd/YefM family antitoxin [Alphaproteobacteria bacterium]
MLLSNARQAISATDLQKKTRELLDRISSGEEDHFVVMRDNRPTAVMMATARYEALMDEIADLQIEARAISRLSTPEEEYISFEDIKAFVDRL